MKYLVIVESPSKCKKIEKYLNDNDDLNIYEVVATMGHINELKSLENIDIKIRPEDCEYSQHDLILRFDDLGKHQYDQWITGSSVDEETSNYKTISARFEYAFNPQLNKGILPNPAYIEWCNQNNLQVMPPWIILGNFKKNKWEIKQLMHQNLSRGLEVGFEL